MLTWTKETDSGDWVAEIPDAAYVIEERGSEALLFGFYSHGVDIDLGRYSSWADAAAQAEEIEQREAGDVGAYYDEMALVEFSFEVEIEDVLRQELEWKAGL